MCLLKRSNLWLFACLACLAGCQKVDLAPDSDGSDAMAGSLPTAAGIRGTGLGSAAYPYSVSDVRNLTLDGDTVWVIGYLVGTAPGSMKAAVFSRDATNQSNILLSADSLCEDTARTVPVELATSGMRQLLALPNNTAHFHQCLMVRGVPAVYLRNRKGLRGVSAGLWLDGFDISNLQGVAAETWEVAPL